MRDILTSNLPARALVSSLAVSAVLLGACSNDTPAATPSDGQGIDVGEPNGPDTGSGSDTRPADQEFTTEERVEMLMGTTREQAENLAIEFGWSVRVGRIDDEQFALTEDYAIGRMTIELDTPGTGEAVVTRITVELEDGPEVFEA